jgi:predicted esterase
MEGVLTSPLRCYYDLEPPSGVVRRKAWPLLIALHGYEGHKESMMRVAHRITAGRMVTISLQGPYQFFLRGEDPKSPRVGFGWGTNYRGLESVALHHHNINALIDLAVRRHHADPKRVFLLAFSQACSYNYRFVFSHPGKIRGVIAVCGGIPGDLERNPALHRAPGTHVLHIAATRDQWYSQETNEAYRRRLPAFAASVDFRFYNSPHKFPRNSIPHIRNWIEKHL